MIEISLNHGAGPEELSAKEGYTVMHMQKRFYSEDYTDGKYVWSCGGQDLKPSLSFAENGVEDCARLRARELVMNPFIGAYSADAGPTNIQVLGQFFHVLSSIRFGVMHCSFRFDFWPSRL